MFEKYDDLRAEIEKQNVKYKRFNVVSFLIGCNHKFTEDDWENVMQLWKENIIEE